MLHTKVRKNRHAGVGKKDLEAYIQNLVKHGLVVPEKNKK